jgi:hypothetical protein
MHDTALIIFYEGQQVNKLHVIDSDVRQILARGKMRDVKPEKPVSDSISSDLSGSNFGGLGSMGSMAWVFVQLLSDKTIEYGSYFAKRKSYRLG